MLEKYGTIFLEVQYQRNIPTLNNCFCQRLGLVFGDGVSYDHQTLGVCSTNRERLLDIFVAFYGHLKVFKS